MELKDLNKLLQGYLKNKLTYAELVEKLPVERRPRVFGLGVIYTSTVRS